MKRIYTLAIILLISSPLFSQKLDYDNDSKWFWGLNAGAAWNTTDVKNKTKVGWGFTLGRAFNYNYGKRISFDLRMRYLNGTWAGQDYDTTSLTNYNSSISPSENVMSDYDSLLGYTVNNFQTRAHELGLEFVIHVNSLRENTGWDPYIFGGANIVFNKTKGNLYFEDTLFGGQYLYDYSPDGISKSEWSDISDDNFETTLDGSFKDNVNFMPSLGIGLAYQFAPRFSMGIEHKTTFAMNDLFDGYIDPTKKMGYFENDIYHYTSAFMRFQLRTRRATGAVTTPTTIPDNNPGTGGIIGSAPCLNPKVKFVHPTNNITVYTSQYTIKAKVKEIAGRDNIVYMFNGSGSTNFLYNGNNENFQSNLILVPGDNIIQIKAGNACGTDVESITINYVDCTAPTIRFINPSRNGITVKQKGFILNANITNSSDVTFFINGIASSNFTYNQSTGSLINSVTLIDGANTFRIVARNDCGTVEETIVVNYADCVQPFISINSGSQIVDNAAFTFEAIITSVNSMNDIGLRLNGMNRTFSFNTTSHLLKATVQLKSGTNTFELFASNSCGTDTETITVEYIPCSLPTILIVAPTVATTNAASVLFKAQVTNVSGFNQLTLIVNGNTIAGGTYNSSTNLFEKTVILQNGPNTIELIAENDCGIARKSIAVTKEFEEEKITICHYPPGNTNNPQEIEIPLSAWPAHQAHGDKLGPCPVIEVEEEKITICHYPPGNTNNPQEIEIPLSAWPAHQAHGDKLGPCPVIEVEEEKITICHYPPGNTNNPQEIEIPLSAWPAHQAHGDKLGPCPVIEVEEEKIMICHYPPGNTNNPQEIEIPLSAWPAHQAHGDKLGPCPVIEVEEEKITICHYPPGNTNNPQEIEIPLSAWPAHQAHGDKLGPCPIIEVEEEKITICHYPPGNTNNPQEIEIPLSAWPAHQAHGDKLGPCPIIEVEEEKVTICHYPPGNTNNPQEIEIPLSAWPAHQAHGDKLGPCPVIEVEEPMIQVCHLNKKTGETKTIKVKQSQLTQHLSHGDKLGKCSDENKKNIPSDIKLKKPKRP